MNGLILVIVAALGFLLGWTVANLKRDGILYIEKTEDGHERWIFEIDPSQVDHAETVTLHVITRKGVDHSES